MGPHRSVATGRRLVRECLADLGAGDDVLVAVSGGADSLALAAATAFESRSAPWTARAIIIDHRLQDGSARVARRAKRQLDALGMAARIVAVAVGDSGGPEAAARTARYGALNDEAAGAILLAHTLDDQAETVLMGLGRGSGPRSIAGMRRVHGRYRRPFLGLRRQDTEAICRAEGLSWWGDPHNDDAAFRRVRIRRELMPLLEDVLGGGAAEALARTAEQLRVDVDYLDTLAAQSAAQTVEHKHEFAVGELETLPEALRLRVLRLAALEAGAAVDELSFGHIHGMDSLITQWRGQKRIELPGHVSASRRGDRIVFGPTPMAG